MLLGKRYLVLVVATLAAVLTGAGPAVAAAPSAQDTTFLRQAHQSNMAEIAAGRLAERQGTSAAVKQLGGRLVADHTRLDDALLLTAATAGVELPEMSTPEQQAVIRQLEAASAADFDALFLSTQLEAHVNAMRLSETQQAQGSDPAIKKAAADAAPVLKAHHEAIERARGGLGAPASVNTGTGGSAAPRPDRAPAAFLIAFGVSLTVLGAAYLLRGRHAAHLPSGRRAADGPRSRRRRAGIR